jgi:cellobiose phosphorylase
MSNSSTEILTTPRRDDLGLVQITNSAGISVSLLPSGAIFAIEHADPKRRIMINQVLGSPIANGMGRLYLRVGGPEPAILSVIGSEAGLRAGASNDRFVWEGDGSGVSHRVTLWLHPNACVWLWRLDVVNRRDAALACDAVLVQDLGLGDQGFLMNNEAYVSQYLDHHIARHPRLDHVMMSGRICRRAARIPGRAWLPRGRRGLRDRFSRVHGPGPS